MGKINPMLLQYAKDNKPFDNPNWIVQLKFDGIRLITDITTDKPFLYTKQLNEVTYNFPELTSNIPFDKGTIVDGEMVVLDEFGKPDFEAMNARFKSKKNKSKVTYCIFDIIKHEGVDVTGLPLWKRQELLNSAFVENEHFIKVRNMNGSATQFFELCKTNGLEGCVLKHSESKYVFGRRTDQWLKVVNWTEMQNVYILGYRKKEFGWLLGVEEEGYIRQVGITELGVDAKTRREGFKKLARSAIKETRDMVYVEPMLKCNVKFRHWTKSNMMRLPVFQGFA